MAANSEQQRWRLGQIFVAERARLLRAVRRRLFDVSTTDAEDLVSDVFYSVLRRGDFVAQVENLTAYVYRALANRIAEYRRTPRREQSLEQAGDRGDDPLRRALEPVSAAQTPEEALASKQLRERIRQALDRLSPAEREVWIATEIEGRPFKDLARQWNVRLGTLLSRKSRASKSLRSSLSDEGSH
jgi:RNA polymerase sigma factor (sigma-70 family)